MLKVAASKIEGFLLFLGSVAASGKFLLRALAPSWDEETFDGTYDLRKHIKHDDKKGEMLLGLREFDKNYEECTVGATGAVAYSLLNHSENTNCPLEMCVKHLHPLHRT